MQNVVSGDIIIIIIIIIVAPAQVHALHTKWTRAAIADLSGQSTVNIRMYVCM